MEQINPTTWGRRVRAHPRNRIDVEVGDASQRDRFYPQFKVKRWDNDAHFSMRHVDTTPGISPTIRVERDRVIWAKTDIEVHHYEQPTAGEDGGFEFEWVLRVRPATNVLAATIQTRNLVFHKQHPLTEAQIAQWGNGRPMRVIGSYAVYHATQGVLVSQRGPNYKTGKVCHIYRPEAIDAIGQRIWCDLDIDARAGLLRVTVPWVFLVNAVYPIRVDPTFGYTSQGASSGGNNKVLYIRASSNPPAGSTLVSLTVWAKQSAGSPLFNPALYSDSSGPSARLAYQDTGGTVIPSGTAVEVTTNLSYSLGNVLYWFGAHTASINDVYLNYYDSPGGITKGYVETPFVYAFPATATLGTSWTDQVSMYGTYADTRPTGPFPTFRPDLA